MLVKAEKTVFGRDFRKFYLNKTKNNKKNRLDDYENDRIIRLFINKLKTKLIEYPSGIHINRIGYFYVHMLPFNMMWNYKNQKVNKYHLTFVPTFRSIFKFWSMDFHFTRSLGERLQNRIKNGYRYLNMIRAVTKKDYYYLGVNKNSFIQYKINRKNEI